MAESEDKDKGFTVQDRRRFSSEGEAKSEQPQEKATAAPSAAEARASGAPPAGVDEPHAEHQPSEISFATFVVGLSTQALSALGEIPDPGTGERFKDLRAAEQLIDIIGMLREKTRGNLDRQEDGLIEAILFDLRMKYVELSRQSSR